MSSVMTHAMAGYAVGCLGLAIDQSRCLDTKTVQHIGGVAAVGLLAGIIPDLDVLPLILGLIKYESFFGHRGFFHSPLFYTFLAPILALALSLGSQSFKKAFWLWTLLLFAALMSHSVLDALTNGGQGVMLYYPVDSHRHFFDWQPIEVAPISITRFFTPRGLRVILSELWFFVPLMIIAIVAKGRAPAVPDSQQTSREEISEDSALKDFMKKEKVLSDQQLKELGD